jgi:hypothetical protein
VLCLPSCSLAHLLEHYCGFKADKRYQLADWRVRPLGPDMLHYARWVVRPCACGSATPGVLECSLAGTRVIHVIKGPGRAGF